MKASMILAAVLTAGACLALPPYVGDGRKAGRTGEERGAAGALRIPSLGILSLKVDKLMAETLETERIPVGKLDVPDLAPLTEDIRKAVKILDGLMLDKRNAFQSRELQFYSNKILQKWVEIYQNEWGPVARVELPAGVRMIAEVRMPQNERQAGILEENIRYRKMQKFNAVLMTFDGTEELDDLTALADWLREQNLRVWFAFGGREELNVPVFIDPERLARYIQALASHADGFLTQWRRTSSHLFIQDQPYMDYLACWARLGNPGIPVVGEAYFGETAEIGGSHDWVIPFGCNRDGIRQNLLFRMAKGGSGYLVVNLSTANIDVESVMKTLLNQFPLPKYILITGPSVYFLTTHRTRNAYEQDLKAIDRIADRWLKAGCRGVIITHGDGHESGRITDNMSVMSHTEIKK